MSFIFRRQARLIPLVIISTFAVAAAVYFLTFARPQPAKTAIKSHDISSALAAGRVTEGANVGGAEVLQTDTHLRYESAEITTGLPKANAVSLQWQQEGGEDVLTEVRTFDGKRWTAWATLGDSDDRKDGTSEALHSTILLTEKAAKAQYRFTLADGQTRISQPRLTAIDATEGPNPTKPSLASKIGSFLTGKAKAARPEGPRVISRTEWGCPEGESSPRWGPEYRPLTRVIVHHTAAAANPSNSAAAVRAVWYQHANTNDWGDIGYNYLVDTNGAIFQGRAYDKAYAEANNQEVVGGHALGNNYGTTGIAALGEFGTQGVTQALQSSIGLMAGYKAMTHSFNPGAGANLVGHRDVYATACPGVYLYNALPGVRGIASNYYTYYAGLYHYDYSYQGQGVNGTPGNTVNLNAFQTAQLYVDLKNEGNDAWSNGGGSPVRLGTSRPLGGASSFYHSSWLFQGRPTTFGGRVTNGVLDTSATTIAPSETARFSFTIQAPNINGSLQAYYQPLAENYTWMRDLGIFWTVNVTPETWAYQWVTQTYAVPTQPDTDGSVSLTVKNTGNVTWTNNGDANTVRIAPSRPNDRTSRLYHASWQSPTRVGSFDAKVVNGVPITTATQIAPGETARFTVPVHTPGSPAVSNEYFNLVAEGKTWLNDVGVFWPLNQPAQASAGQGYHVQWAGQSVSPTINKSSNPVGSLSFDYTNTGSYAWTKNVLRLGTANPLDRTSIYRNGAPIGASFATFGLTSSSTPALPSNAANWLSANRAATFAGRVNVDGSLDTSATTIAPTQKGRFIVALDARNVPPGTYREYFRPVADGWAWLEDFGVYLDVTVQ